MRPVSLLMSASTALRNTAAIVKTTVNISRLAVACTARASAACPSRRAIGHRYTCFRRSELSFLAVVCTSHRYVAALVQTTVGIEILAVACTTDASRPDGSRAGIVSLLSYWPPRTCHPMSSCL